MQNENINERLQKLERKTKKAFILSNLTSAIENDNILEIQNYIRENGGNKSPKKLRGIKEEDLLTEITTTKQEILQGIKQQQQQNQKNNSPQKIGKDLMRKLEKLSVLLEEQQKVEYTKHLKNAEDLTNTLQQSSKRNQQVGNVLNNNLPSFFLPNYSYKTGGKKTTKKHHSHHKQRKTKRCRR